MGNKRMGAEGKRFCRWLVLINKRKIWGILYSGLAVSLFLTGCGQAAPAHGSEGEYAGEPGEIDTEIAADSPEETENRTEADPENGEETEDSAEEVLENWKKNTVNVIVGTWKNIPDPEKEGVRMSVSGKLRSCLGEKGVDKIESQWLKK